jgi:PadR family transcriptional regulator, regulatory protein PadR
MHAERELLKGNTQTLVLAVLQQGALHGYAIARAIERRSGDALRFKEGTLYPALHALEAAGHIRGEWERSEGGRERKVYSLTPSGHTVLEERTRTWERFATAVQRVLEGEPDGGAPELPYPVRKRSLDPEPAG